MKVQKAFLLYRQTGILTRHIFITTDEELASKWKELRPQEGSIPLFQNYNGVTEFILVEGVDAELLQKISDEQIFIESAMSILKAVEEKE